MLGASAVSPSAASRSQTFLMCRTRPHHSWMTRTPGPFPDGGVARYADVLVEFDGKSIILPGIAQEPPLGSGVIFTAGARRASGRRTVIGQPRILNTPPPARVAPRAAQTH